MIKVILLTINGLANRVPMYVFLSLILIAQTMYIAVDYYVLDLSPSIGTYYNGRLEDIEAKLDVLYDACIDETANASPSEDSNPT